MSVCAVSVLPQASWLLVIPPAICQLCSTSAWVFEYSSPDHCFSLSGSFRWCLGLLNYVLELLPNVCLPLTLFCCALGSSPACFTRHQSSINPLPSSAGLFPHFPTFILHLSDLANKPFLIHPHSGSVACVIFPPCWSWYQYCFRFNKWSVGPFSQRLF